MKFFANLILAFDFSSRVLSFSLLSLFLFRLLNVTKKRSVTLVPVWQLFSVVLRLCCKVTLFFRFDVKVKTELFYYLKIEQHPTFTVCQLSIQSATWREKKKVDKSSSFPALLSSLQTVSRSFCSKIMQICVRIFQSVQAGIVGSL